MHPFSVNKDMCHFYLYSITSPSGKVYIGQTRSFKKRVNTYKNKRCVAQRILFNSIKKYGWENHRLEIIVDGIMTQDKIDKLEIDAIEEARRKNLCMNICDGGVGKINSFHRPIIQFDLKGKLIKRWKSATEAAENIKEILNSNGICMAIKENRFYSYGYLWLYAEDYDAGKRVSYNPNKKRICVPVVQLTLDRKFVKEYQSIKAAAIEMKCSQEIIGSCARKRSGSARNYLWCYKSDYENGKLPPPVLIENALRERPVEMLSKEGKFIRMFTSIKEAAKTVNISRNTITKQCGGKVVKGHHFTFRYCS